ncbi:MAG: Sporulation related domain protein [Bacteroidetes bacterium ADurb.Bin408]|nr:MAG: Sporulation related domain protein [Bacteroidetes bacterium ADurb.Bin408]
MRDTAGNHNPSYVCYTAPDDSYERLSKFYLTRLFYGKTPRNTYIKYYIDGKENRAVLKADADVNELVLNNVKPYKELRIEFFTDSILDVYGVSFEMPKGVYIDNFAVRGNLGMALQKIPENVLRGFNEYMDYSLLIFQFGLNVAAPEARGFGWYENAMVDVISYYKKNIPDADILIISIGDKSHKYDMEYVTQPGIPRLVEAQRNIARRTQSHFWNLYANMGGYNSMKAWVEAKLPLASKDYAHINFAGAEKISKMLSENIFNEFKLFEYEKLKNDEKDIIRKNILNTEKRLTDDYLSFENQYKIIAAVESRKRTEHNIIPEDFEKTMAHRDTSDKKESDKIVKPASGDICEFRVQVAASKAELEVNEYKHLLTYANNKILRKIKHKDGFNRVYITPFSTADSAQRIADTLVTLGGDAFVVGFINDNRAPIEKVAKRMQENCANAKKTEVDTLIHEPVKKVAGLRLDKNEKHTAQGFFTFAQMPGTKAPALKSPENYVYITGQARAKKYDTPKPVELPVFRVQFCASEVPLEKSFYQNVVDYFGDSMVIISKEEDGMIRYMLGEYAGYEEAVRALNKVFELKQDGFVTAYYHNKRIKPEKAIEIIKKSKK